MSYKPEESTLISYLYGELSGDEKQKIEDYLSSNPEARNELSEMKSALGIMSQLKDKEVDVPSFTFDNTSRIVVASGTAVHFWRKSLAIAASIAIILFMGYLTQFNASYDSDGFKLAFGETEQGYNQEQVASMIADAIAKNNVDMNQVLASSEAGMREYVRDNNQSLQNQLVRQVSNNPVSESDFEHERQAYLDYLKQLIEDSETSQKKYMDQAMTDFAIFLDIQRQNDLEVIQTRFENFQDNAELNQFQTNQILANLISSVEEPVQQPNQY
ncbi:hypothetical protein [Ekhidna sp.]